MAVDFKYQLLKVKLIGFAKNLSFDDKPLRRMEINDYVDNLSKQEMNGISEKKAELYKERLSDLACKLHDKNLD